MSFYLTKFSQLYKYKYTTVFHLYSIKYNKQQLGWPTIKKNSMHRLGINTRQEYVVDLLLGEGGGLPDFNLTKPGHHSEHFLCLLEFIILICNNESKCFSVKSKVYKLLSNLNH